MATWQIVLEFLKVLLSWPPVVGITIVFFLILFRDELRGLLNSIYEVSGPGNFSAFFEGIDENMDVDELLKNYPKWKELLSHIIEDVKTFKKEGHLKPELPLKKDEQQNIQGKET